MRPNSALSPRAFFPDRAARPSPRGAVGRRLWLALAALALATLGPASAGFAESSLMLHASGALEAIGATTFDEEGRAIGRSNFEVETRDDGSRRMHVAMAVDGGGSTVSQATLVPVAPLAHSAEAAAAGASGRTPAFRVVEERSQSRSADGKTFPLLVVDHARGRVSCYPDGEPESAGRHLEIPDEDRVVNVPMQLFFQPLVMGEVDSLHFQIATCGNAVPVLHAMIAVRGPKRVRDGREIVEIEYGPDLGETIAWLASRLLPSFSFWFDAGDGTYLGHRMPLHRKGPEVTLVRQGLTPPEIGID